MKTYNVPESFILEAHKEACDKWKKKIESIAPDLFQKLSFKVGEWVSMDDGRGSALICYQGKDNNHYGFNWAGEWTTCFGNTTLNDCPEQCRLATKEEIEKHLIAEAEKRGFKEGVMVTGLWDANTPGYRFKIQTCGKNRFEYFKNDDRLVLENACIYKQGNWATIISAEKVRLTLEDIAKLKGVDVSLIEIVK